MTFSLNYFLIGLALIAVVVVPNVEGGSCCGGKKHVHEDNSEPINLTGSATLLPGLRASKTPLPDTDDPPFPERPEANLVSLDILKAYCSTAPEVSAPCALFKMCSAIGDKAPSYVCGTTSIASLVCRVDKDTTFPGSKELCQDFAQHCPTDKCHNLGWPTFRPSSRYQMAIFKMCDYHAKRGETMVGCDSCPLPPTGIMTNLDDNDWNKLTLTCTSFVTYGHMCTAMPGMGACSVWREMCSAVPNAGKTFPEWCNPEAMAARDIRYNSTLAQSDQQQQPIQLPQGSNAIIPTASFMFTGVALLAALLTI